MFAAPPVIPTRLYARLPDSLRRQDGPKQVLGNAAPAGGAFHSLLEGPAFDRAGNLYCVDIPNGRVLRVSPQGDWTVFAEYDGKPTGLKIHKDGRVFVADYQNGIVAFDEAGGAPKTIVDHYDGEKLFGVNDLVFSRSGDIYFTDPGASDLSNPVGRVFRLAQDGVLELLMGGLAYPNGLALDPSETTLYVAVTRSLQLIRIPVPARGAQVTKSGVFVQMSGGMIGPNGVAIDVEGNVAAVQAGLGAVWVFDRFGEPIARVTSCAGRSLTNLAYGGEADRELFITEAETGSIIVASMPTAGHRLYSHLGPEGDSDHPGDFCG